MTSDADLLSQTEPLAGSLLRVRASPWTGLSPKLGSPPRPPPPPPRAASILPRFGFLSAPPTCLAGASFSGTRPLPPAPDPAPVLSPMAPPVPTPRPGVPGYLQRGGRGCPSRRRRGTCARPNSLGVRRPRAAAAPSPLPAFSRRQNRMNCGIL